MYLILSINVDTKKSFLSRVMKTSKEFQPHSERKIVSTSKIVGGARGFFPTDVENRSHALFHHRIFFSFHAQREESIFPTLSLAAACLPIEFITVDWKITQKYQLHRFMFHRRQKKIKIMLINVFKYIFLHRCLFLLCFDI